MRTISDAEVVHRACRLILDERLKASVWDIKVITHTDRAAQLMDGAWEYYGSDLSAIFSDEELRKNGPSFDVRRKWWHKWSYDIAKTGMAMWNRMRMGEAEFHMQPDVAYDEPLLSPSEVMSKVSHGVRIVDFDIRRRNDSGQQYSAAGCDLKYDTDPVMEQAGVPDHVSIHDKIVDPSEVEHLQARWGSELYVALLTGKLATQKCVENHRDTGLSRKRSKGGAATPDLLIH